MYTNIVTVLAALMAGVSGMALVTGQAFVTDNLASYGVPERWWPALGGCKITGAAGLLVGLWHPVGGIIAACGLVLYFTGAVIAVARARFFGHVAYPVIYMLPAAAAGFLLAAG